MSGSHQCTPAPVPDGFRLGSFTIHWLQGGEFEIDGGSMFGVVPRLLWEKKCPCGADGYVRLADSPILVRGAGFNLLIDTGLGNKLSPKQQAIFRVGPNWDVPASLARLGVSREEITHVVLTHGDFDHAAGTTMLDARGEPGLTFPKALHFLQRAEWEDILAPNRRSASAYWPENFAGLKEGVTLRLVDEEEEIIPGVRLIRTGGHTRGHQAVWLESGGEIGLHLGDLLPMPAYANPLWITAYDNFPLDSVAAKERLLSEAREANAWLLFYHDPRILACRLDEEGRVLDPFSVEG
ncbi:MAG: MBL fold metallo-hydrolase [Thermodesulfobacteriota bacterium]